MNAKDSQKARTNTTGAAHASWTLMYSRIRAEAPPKSINFFASSLLQRLRYPRRSPHRRASETHTAAGGTHRGAEKPSGAFCSRK
jgi:hypothetical protein